MTDREKFQKTFSKLHASPDLLTEVMKMEEKRRYHMPKVAVAAIAQCMLDMINDETLGVNESLGITN